MDLSGGEPPGIFTKGNSSNCGKNIGTLYTPLFVRKELTTSTEAVDSTLISSERRQVKVILPQVKNFGENPDPEPSSIGGSKIPIPQAEKVDVCGEAQISEFEWTQEELDHNENKKFLHLLPKTPLDGEIDDILVDVNIQLLPDNIKKNALEYSENKIVIRSTKYQFVCVGKKKNKKPHEADEETFKRKGICKECLYEDYDNLNEMQAQMIKKQTKRKTTKKTDVKLKKINDELEKLPQKKKKAIEKLIPEKYREDGEEYKKRLCGLKMGHHLENKGRKVNQFSHNSTLNFYAYRLMCLTYVYDPAKNDLLLVTSPELLEDLEETSSRLKVPGARRTPVEAATKMLKLVFKEMPRHPPIPLAVQENARNVWNAAFAKKEVTEDGNENLEDYEGVIEDLDDDEDTESVIDDLEAKENENVDPKAKKNNGPKSKKMKSASSPTPPNENTITLLKGNIVEVFEDKSSIIQACKGCNETSALKMVADEQGEHKEVVFCPSEKCAKVVKTRDYFVVQVKLKLFSPIEICGISTDEVSIQLEDEEVFNLLPEETALTPEALMGCTVGPMVFRFDIDNAVWKKYSPDD